MEVKKPTDGQNTKYIKYGKVTSDDDDNDEPWISSVQKEKTDQDVTIRCKKITSATEMELKVEKEVYRKKEKGDNFFISEYII